MYASTPGTFYIKVRLNDDNAGYFYNMSTDGENITDVQTIPENASGTGIKGYDITMNEDGKPDKSIRTKPVGNYEFVAWSSEPKVPTMNWKSADNEISPSVSATTTTVTAYYKPTGNGVKTITYKTDKGGTLEGGFLPVLKGTGVVGPQAGSTQNAYIQDFVVDGDENSKYLKGIKVIPNDDGYEFLGWAKEDGTIVSYNPEFTPNINEIDGDVTYTAQFRDNYIRISYNTNGDGEVSTASENVAKIEDLQGSTAIPKDNSYFAAWTDTNGNVLSINPSFIPDANLIEGTEATFTAVFTNDKEMKIAYLINISPEDGFLGKWSNKDNGGDFTNKIADPYPGTITGTSLNGDYDFDFLSVNGSRYESNQIHPRDKIKGTDTIVPTIPYGKPTIIKAYFRPSKSDPENDIKYVVKNINGGYGNLTNEVDYISDNWTIQGSTAISSATAEFVEWQDENGNPITNNPTFMPSNTDAGKTFVAVFKNKRIEITYKKEGNGKVSPASEIVKEPEEIKGSKATPDDGYFFVAWKDKSGRIVSLNSTFIPEGDQIEDGATYTAVFSNSDEMLVCLVNVNPEDGKIVFAQDGEIKGDYTNVVDTASNINHTLQGWVIANDKYVYDYLSVDGKKYTNSEGASAIHTKKAFIKYDKTNGTLTYQKPTIIKAYFRPIDSNEGQDIKYATKNIGGGAGILTNEVDYISNDWTIQGSTAINSSTAEFIEWQDAEGNFITDNPTFMPPKNSEGKTFYAVFKSVESGRLLYNINLEGIKDEDVTWVDLNNDPIDKHDYFETGLIPTSLGIIRYSDKKNYYLPSDEFTVLPIIPQIDGYLFIGWFDKNRTYNNLTQDAIIRHPGDTANEDGKYYTKDKQYSLDALWLRVENADNEEIYSGIKEHTIGDLKLEIDDSVFDKIQSSSEGDAKNYLEQLRDLGEIKPTVKYKLAKTDKTYEEEDPPTYKDVGTYTVYYYITVDVLGRQYSTPDTATVTVLPYPIKIVADDIEEPFIYGDDISLDSVVYKIYNLTNENLKDENGEIKKALKNNADISGKLTELFTAGVNENSVELLDEDIFEIILSTLAQKGSNKGKYNINIDLDDAKKATLPYSNYKIYLEPGKLTIDPKEVTIYVVTDDETDGKPCDATRGYGKENPKFSVDLTEVFEEDRDGIIYKFKQDYETYPEKYAQAGSKYDIEIEADKEQGNYIINIKNGKLTIVESKRDEIHAAITAENYLGYYDKNAHTIKIAGIIEGEDTVQYLVDGEWVNELPTYINVKDTPKEITVKVTNPNTIEGEVTAKATVTILPIPVTVKANDVHLTYGDQIPELSAEVILNEEAIDGLDDELKAKLQAVLESEKGQIDYELSTTAGAVGSIPNAGQYEINVATEADQDNYIVNHIDGTLTVEPKKVTITAEKIWEGDEANTTKRPDHVTLILKEDGVEKDRKDANEDNDWKVTFKTLEQTKEVTYTVEEEGAGNTESKTSPLYFYDTKVENDGLYNKKVTNTFNYTTVTVHHYIKNSQNRVPSKEGGEVLDEIIEGRKGDNYTTHASDKIPDNYEFVDVNGTPNGTMPDTPSEVIYYYDYIEPTISTNTIQKEGTTGITSKDQEVSYKITYDVEINDYKGQATITIVDTLPYELDEEKTDMENGLDGGTYNKASKTIIWTETVSIDTYTTGTAYTDQIIKNIKVVYANIDTNKTEIKNTAKGKIELKTPEKIEETEESNHDTDLNFKINVTATKVWDDNSNVNNKRPQEITLVLKANNNEKETYDISSSGQEDADEWTYTFTQLPKYDENGNEITYTVAEREKEIGGLKFYEQTSITGDMTEGFTITNTFKVPDEKIKIPVTKIWDDNGNTAGKRPGSVTLQIKKNGGAELVTEQLVTEANKVEGQDNKWSYEFSVPKYDARGDEIEYTIDEADLNNIFYTYANAVINQDEKTITNRFVVPDTKISIDVAKIWDDKEDIARKRPENVTLILAGNGQQYRKTLTVADKDNNYTETGKEKWKATIDGLPMYDAKGDVIEYTLSEETIEGIYYTQVNIDQANKTVTNTFVVPNETVDIEVTKIWDDNNNIAGKRPENITIKVTGTRTDGKPNVENSYVLSGNSTAERWTYTFEELPKYDDYGNVISYTIDESDTGSIFYIKDNTKINQAYKTITNTFKVPNDKVEVAVTKIWDDNNNIAGKRPENITITVTGTRTDGKENVVQSHVLSGNSTAERWTYTFEELPKYDDYGNVISYTIDESDTGSIFYIRDNTIINQADKTITNKFVVPNDTVEVPVTKIWDDVRNIAGKRPSEITIILTAQRTDGQSDIREHKLTGESTISNWTYTFTQLPKYDTKGNTIEYVISEKDLESEFYIQSNINQNERTITNKFQVPSELVKITVTKIWDDNGNIAGKRPTSVTLQIKKNNGTELVTATTVTEANKVEGQDNKWSYEFSVPKYDEMGDVIEYTIDEADLNDIFYTYENADINQVERTITNRFVVPDERVSVPVTKVWDDKNDENFQRPEKIVITLYANGSAKDTYEMSAADQENTNASRWTHTFTGLPKYDSFGNEIKYSVDESAKAEGELKFYKKQITSGNVTGGVTITNKIDYAKVTVHHYILGTENEKVPAAAGGEVADEIIEGAVGTEYKTEVSDKIAPNYEYAGEFEGKIEGKMTEEQIVVTYYYKLKDPSISNSKITKEGPKETITDKDSKVSYNIQYTATINDYIGDATLKIVDKLPYHIDEQASELANGIYSESDMTITWTIEIQGIDSYKNEKNTINIFKNIKLVYTDIDLKGNSITNKVTGMLHLKTPEKDYEKDGNETTKTDFTIDIPVEKIWEDNNNEDQKRPDSIKIKLKANDEEKEEITLNKDNNWKHTFKNLPKYDDNRAKITYTVEEKETKADDFKYYNSKITSDNIESGVKITNTLNYAKVKVHHYIVGSSNQVPSKNGGKVADELIEGNIGDKYSTAESSQISPNYELDSISGEPEGDMAEGTTVVIYYYKLKTPNLDEPSITKTAITNKITDKNAEVKYKITYEVSVKDYIGDATVTIVDELPYHIDPAKSELADGKYDKESKTITWVEDLKGINSYEEDIITITKEITLVYTDIDVTQYDMVNKVTGSLKLLDTEKSSEDQKAESEAKDEAITEIDVQGKVTVKYKDQNTGEDIFEEEVLQGKVGTNFDISSNKKEKEGYTIVGEPEKTGKYQEADQEKVYYYAKNTTVHVRYVDQLTGEELAKDITIEGYEGKYYKTEQKEIENYYFVKDTKNTEGKMAIKTIEVIYYYMRPAKVVVSHVEKATGNKLLEEEVIVGHDGDPYITEAKDIQYYNLLEKPENAEGKMSVTLKVDENNKQTVIDTIYVTWYYEKKTFNLSLEKIISSIIENGKETKINGNLAKIELYRKSITSNNVEIVYTIKVSNNSELAGNAVIKENIPAGTTMSKDKNAEWTINGNTATLKTDDIRPGEERVYTVRLDWVKDENNMGQLRNMAEIIRTENEAGFEEQNSDDDKDTADVLISIETGTETTHIAMTLISLVMLAGIILKKRNKSGKHAK